MDEVAMAISGLYGDPLPLDKALATADPPQGRDQVHDGLPASGEGEGEGKREGGGGGEGGGEGDNGIDVDAEDGQGGRSRSGSAARRSYFIGAHWTQPGNGLGSVELPDGSVYEGKYKDGVQAGDGK